MSSSETNAEDKHMILILDTDPSHRKFNCPLTRCNHSSSSAATVLNHMWKFKKFNSKNKICTGQQSLSLTLYPKLFRDGRFRECTERVLSLEFPSIEWKTVHEHMESLSLSPLPSIVSLIEQFDFLITSEFMDVLRQHTDIAVPDALREFGHFLHFH